VQDGGNHKNKKKKKRKGARGKVKEFENVSRGAKKSENLGSFLF
jgi:hypothetical protein